MKSRDPAALNLRVGKLETRKGIDGGRSLSCASILALTKQLMSERHLTLKRIFGDSHENTVIDSSVFVAKTIPDGLEAFTMTTPAKKKRS